MSNHQEDELQQRADAYLRKHRIVELFEDLCTQLCFNQPEDAVSFIVQQLQLKQSQGFVQIIKGFITGVFKPEEIKNIFLLFDLKKDGYIDKQKCQQALKILASSQLQNEKIDQADIPQNVDQFTFLKLANNILGLTYQ